MNQADAEEIYLNQVQRAEDVINSMGNNPQRINAYITNTYLALSQKEPAFLWFSLGSMVSSTVGINLQVATQTSIHSAGQARAANVVLENLSKGNQDIFKDIVPLFLTYEAVGIEGIELLSKSNIDNPFQNEQILDAMRNYSQLHLKQVDIARSLGLSLNHPSVINQLFSDKKNIKAAHDVAMSIATEEQIIVNDIYEQELVEIMLDPTLNWIGHQAKLDEIQILEKTYNFFEYIEDPADFDQRLNFAETLLTAVENGISKGEFNRYQSDVQKMAEQTLWMANPYTLSHALGEVNGAFWGQLADEHDKKVKESILDFLNVDKFITNEIANPVDVKPDIIPSVFTGEHEIVEVKVDPLAYFLATHPNYEVIANDIAELKASKDFKHSLFNGGMILSNPNKPYLKNSSYLIIYDDGEYQYYQPEGEVRGITFPFMYDKNTGIPLTMPIVDVMGHYKHTSTLDTIYNDPKAFDTPSHINWYNPYWNEVVREANKVHMYHKYTELPMESILQPLSIDFGFEYNSKNQKGKNPELYLKGSDIFHDSGNLDFSNVKGSNTNSGSGSYNLLITGMKLADGTYFEVDKSGNFVCTNCKDHSSSYLEGAANSMLHHVEG